MKDIEKVKEEFHSKKIEVYKLIEIMREKGISETDLAGIESNLFDLSVCFRSVTE
jgi:hypothetical protein